MQSFSSEFHIESIGMTLSLPWQPAFRRVGAPVLGNFFLVLLSVSSHEKGYGAAIQFSNLSIILFFCFLLLDDAPLFGQGFYCTALSRWGVTPGSTTPGTTSSSSSPSGYSRWTPQTETSITRCCHPALNVTEKQIFPFSFFVFCFALLRQLHPHGLF